MTDRQVLMLIDMQAVFAVPPSPWASPQYPGAEAQALRLRSAYPDDRTAITRYLPPSPVQGAWVAYFEAWPFALDPEQADYDLMPGFEPGGATLVERTTFGKWDAVSQQAMSFPDTIVLAGVSTDCCVISTALAAADAGVRVLVAADACAGASPADHQRALDAMALYAPLIRITDTETLLRQSLPG